MNAHCDDFARRVMEMSAAYKTRLGLAKESTLTEEQSKRADLTHGIVDFDGRAERGLAMLVEFHLCSSVRGDESERAEIDRMEDRFMVAVQSYREAFELDVQTKAANELSLAVKELERFDLGR